MTSLFNMPSHQSATSSMGVRGNSIETGAAEKTLEGMVWGHGISPVTEGSVLEIASIRQDSGTTETARNTSLCLDTTMKKAIPKVVTAMPIDKHYSEQLRLPHELETIGEPKNFTETSEWKSGNDKQLISNLIRDAYNLKSNGRQLEALKKTTTALELAFKYPEDSSIRSRIYQCRAYISYASNMIEKALYYFAEAEEGSDGPTNLPERLFVMHLMIGMGGDGHSVVFQPDNFYNEVKKWVKADAAEDKKIEQSLEEGFGKYAPHIRVFRDGLKAIFEKGVDTKTSNAILKQAIAKLTKIKEGQSPPEILKCLVPMLRFAQNLELMKKGHIANVVENVSMNLFGLEKNYVKPEQRELQHLDEYLIAMAAENQASHIANTDVTQALDLVNVAINGLEDGIVKGYPVSTHLLEKVKKLRLFLETKKNGDAIPVSSATIRLSGGALSEK